MSDPASKRYLTQEVGISELPEDGSVSGTVGEDELILIRRGDNLFAVGAYCTHYHGSLAEGLVVGDTGRCRIRYRAGARVLAVAAIARDRESLQAELDMERGWRVH